jgi:exopolysaccharide biosynthesis WecB/TagA/CpsF family protein
MARRRILNIEVDDLTLQEFLEQFDAGFVVTPNVDHLVMLQSRPDFLDVYRRADFATVDSQIVKWALGFLGTPVKARLSGSDVFPAFCNFHGHDPEVKIFLLGGRDDVAEAAARRINARIGRPMVVGWRSPSLSFVTDEHEVTDVIAQIEASGANVLAVGLGAPKQELWIDTHRHRTIRFAADRLTALEAQPLGHVDFPDRAFAQLLLVLPVTRHREHGLNERSGAIDRAADHHVLDHRGFAPQRVDALGELGHITTPHREVVLEPLRSPRYPQPDAFHHRVVDVGVAERTRDADTRELTGIVDGPADAHDSVQPQELDGHGGIVQVETGVADGHRRRIVVRDGVGLDDDARGICGEAERGTEQPD